MKNGQCIWIGISPQEIHACLVLCCPCLRLQFLCWPSGGSLLCQWCPLSFAGAIGEKRIHAEVMLTLRLPLDPLSISSVPLHHLSGAKAGRKDPRCPHLFIRQLYAKPSPWAGSPGGPKGGAEIYSVVPGHQELSLEAVGQKHKIRDT